MDRRPVRLTEVDDTAIGRPDGRRTAAGGDVSAPGARRAQVPTVHHATYALLVVVSGVGAVALLVLVRALVG